MEKRAFVNPPVDAIASHWWLPQPSSSSSAFPCFGVGGGGGGRLFFFLLLTSIRAKASKQDGGDTGRESFRTETPTTSEDNEDGF